MANIGKAFGFCIKHWREMAACYTENPSRAILRAKLPLETQKMIDKVGDRAAEQARQFLTKCSQRIVDYFDKSLKCQAKVRNKRSYVETYWDIYAILGPKHRRKSARICWCAGALIGQGHHDHTPAIFLYLWARGRDAEDDLAALLGEDRVKGRAAEFDAASGTIAFGKIPLKVKHDDETFEIEEEELLEKVRESLRTIRKKDVERLFEI